MEVSHCLIGNTPYITNIKVYSAGIIYDGALMMLNASAWTSGDPADGSAYSFTIAAADDNTCAIDAIGSVQEGTQKAFADYINVANNAAAFKIGSDYYADAAISVGGNYLPVCISPQVMYYAEYFQKADNASGVNIIDGADITSSTGTTATIADLQDHLDGGFLFSTKGTDSAAYEPGQFRYITVSGATGSCTIDSAMKIDGTNTDLILGLPPLCPMTGLTDDAVGMCSLTDKGNDDPSEGICENILVMENWITHRSAELHPVRYWADKGMDGLKNFRAFAELKLFDHLWNAIPA